MEISAIMIIGFVSIVLGSIKYRSIYKDELKKWTRFVEWWNDFINFLITGLVGYYFVLVRLPSLLKGEYLILSDLVLFIIFMLGIFGHLCVMSKNITDGIETIFKRVLERK